MLAAQSCNLILTDMVIDFTEGNQTINFSTQFATAFCGRFCYH